MNIAFTKDGKGSTAISPATRRDRFLKNKKSMCFFESGLCIFIYKVEARYMIGSEEGFSGFSQRVTEYPRYFGKHHKNGILERQYSWRVGNCYKKLKDAKRSALSDLDERLSSDTFVIPRKDDFITKVTPSGWVAIRKNAPYYDGCSKKSRHRVENAWGKASSKRAAQADMESWLGTLSE